VHGSKHSRSLVCSYFLMNAILFYEVWLCQIFKEFISYICCYSVLQPGEEAWTCRLHFSAFNSWQTYLLGSNRASVFFFVCFVPSKLTSSAQNRNRCVPATSNPSLLSWTFLVAYSLVKMRNNVDKAPPYFRPLWVGTSSDKCLLLAFIYLFICSLFNNSFSVTQTIV
jgi:hypothetical protein